MTPISTRPPAQQVVTEAVELVVAPAAIERALHLYEQLQPHDTSVILQARKILTQHIFGMVDQGELDEQKLIAGGLAHLKAIERDRGIKTAHPETGQNAASSPAWNAIKGSSMMEPVPLLTVGDLKSELSRWSNETPVTFYSPLREQEFRFYRYRPGDSVLVLEINEFPETSPVVLPAP